MNTATFHPLTSIRQYSEIAYTTKGRAHSIKYVHFARTNQTLVVIDSSYAQYLGYRNRTDMLEVNSILQMAEEILYHCRSTNRIFSLGNDRNMQQVDLKLYPIS